MYVPTNVINVRAMGFANSHLSLNSIISELFGVSSPELIRVHCHTSVFIFSLLLCLVICARAFNWLARNYYHAMYCVGP